jgi:hypothetical protein
MSGNVATLAGGAAGAFVGSFFGMPGLGFSIGSGLAGMAFAPKPKGNSVDPGDLSFDTSAYGKFQPWGYGTYLVQGPVTFWSTDYVAHKHTEKVGGKGGGAGKQKVETITYTRSFAVYLADCTNGSPIVGVRRIWDAISGQMLYDVGEGGDTETLIASQWMAKAVRVYTGALDQQPDALIEAHEDWAPAWRGHAYVVFEDWDHGGSKQAPVLAIEVVTAGATDRSADRVAYLGDQPGSTSLSLTASSYDAGLVRTLMAGNYNGAFGEPADALAGVYTPEGVLVESNKRVLSDEGAKQFLIQNSTERIVYESADGWLVTGGGIMAEVTDGFRSRLTTDGQFYYGARYQQYEGTVRFYKWRLDGSIVASNMEFSTSFDVSPFAVHAASGSPYLVVANTDNSLRHNGETIRGAVVDAETLSILKILPTISGLVIGVSGSSLAYVYDSPQTIYVYSLPDWIVLRSYPANQGTTLDSTYISTVYSDFLMLHYGDLYALHDALPVGTATLASVLADLCDRADLEVADYDTSLLPSTPIRLTIDRLRSARDWLTELGQVYRFRLRNSGGKLQFVPKGGGSVATIPQGDLGLDVGEGIPPPITASRTQGIDLPRSVTVVFSDAGNDYAPGQQQYVMRQYPQGQDITLTVTAILTAAEALELAQIAAKEPHLERLSWTTSVGIKHLALEAGDVVDLPTGRVWVRDIQEQGDSILRATFVAEAAAAYSGNGLPAPATTAPVRSIALAGPTRMELLDIPILQDADDGPGIYLAALGYLSGWSGAEVYRSDDGEVFDQLASVVTAAVVGTTTNALAAGTTTIWDRANTLNVTLIDGSLSSASELNVLNGANAALVGAHGRWEVIQFETATLEADGSYTLAKLLRGRKGTEWAVGTHQAGDTFVLLTSNTLGRVDKSLNDIGATRNYKAVSLGNDIAAAATIEFANQGVGLKPYAPAHANGSRNGSGDLMIKWIRRTRIGGEWRDYVDASLGEDSESYEVDIMNGSTVVRTLAVTSPTVTYTAADQTTDFGSTQSSITLRVYQLSADIGRGYKTEKTL